MPQSSKKDYPEALRQCQTCFRKSAEMRSCSRCHRAHYCNSECQTRDWKMHKAACKHDTLTAALLKVVSKAAKGKFPDGVHDPRKLASDLKRWTQIQGIWLTRAVIHGLELTKKPSNAASLCLQIEVERNSSTDVSVAFTPGAFSVVTIEQMLDLAQMRGTRGMAAEIVRRSKASAAAVPDGFVAITILMCEPFMHLTPVGLDFVPDDIEDDDNWQESFRQTVLT